MKCKNWPIGVCSWSLQTDVNGVADAMKKIGIDTIHLGVRAALGADGNDFLKAVENQDWNISATMIDFPQEDYSTLDSIKVTGGIGPDEHWEQNQELFLGAADVTVKLFYRRKRCRICREILRTDQVSGRRGERKKYYAAAGDGPGDGRRAAEFSRRTGPPCCRR